MKGDKVDIIYNNIKHAFFQVRYCLLNSFALFPFLAIKGRNDCCLALQSKGQLVSGVSNAHCDFMIFS